MTSTGMQYDAITSEDYRRHRKLNVPVSVLMSYDYVRATLFGTCNPYQVGKRKKPLFGEQHGQLIGYATVARDGRHAFTVLIWWHKHHDRDIEPDGVYRLPPERRKEDRWRHWGPSEAVPPSRVLEFFPESWGC
jgi:hypothetical protein